MPKRGVLRSEMSQFKNWDTVTIPQDHVRLYITAKEEILVSDGHKFSKLSANGPDRGGNFHLRKQVHSATSTLLDKLGPSPSVYLRKDRSASGKEVFLFNGAYGTTPNPAFRRFVGPQHAKYADVVPTSTYWPNTVALTDVQLDAYGTSAISRCLPTNSVADLAVFFGELRREGIPKLIGSAALKRGNSGSRKAAEEYLNLEFGWKPIVRDVQKFARAVRDSEMILAQYEKKSGQPVRRRYEFPVIVNTGTPTVEATSVYPYPGAASVLYTGSGTRTKTVNFSQRIWFSGSFTYYLEPLKGKRDKGFLQRANKLLGVRLTPETLWNLAPWSWAADWFSNAGDVYRNISAFANDGLTMPYAYIMAETTTTNLYTLSGVKYKCAPGSHTFTQAFTTVVKQRRRATPYGFGLNPSVDFTTRQWAIAGALGLTKSDRSLRYE